MRIINWAHGELFMLGAYMVLVLSQAGRSYWLALALAPILVALVGMVIERLFVRHLYKELVATILLTWGLSICLRQLVRLIVGPEWKYVGNPLPGSVSFLGISYPVYRIFIIFLAVVMMSLVAYLMLKTRFGLYCRAVRQNREMAAALGVDTDRIDLLSFGLGSALAGVAGAAMAPLVTIQPDMGLSFLGDAFLVVIVGGAGSIMGIVASALALSGVRAILSFSIDPVWSYILMLLFATGIIRFRPQGILAPRRED
jgi:branched-chain amino acid transport system permease protein/urea transport system permease protein